MNFEFMTIDTPLPPCMPFPRALTGFPVSSTAKVMYTDADGNLIRLTCDDFASAAEFQRWKDWSDSDLRKEENADHKQSDNSISLEVLSEEATAVVSIEDEYMEQISADEAAV